MGHGITPWKAHVRALSDATTEILSWVQPPPPVAIWTQIHTLDTAMRAFSEEVSSILPLPSPDTAPDAEVDAAVATAIRAAFVGNRPTDTDLRVATDSNRVHVKSGAVVIPLPQVGHAVANWYVLVGIVSNTFTDLADRLRRAAGRLELVDRVTESGAICDVATALEDTVTVLEHAAVRTLWLDPPDRLVNVDHTWVREYATRMIRTYNQHA